MNGPSRSGPFFFKERPYTVGESDHWGVAKW